MEQVIQVPEEPKREYTSWEKLANWLHYNIWWVAAILFAAVVFSSLILTKAKQEAQRCDYCIAYVATRELPAECQEELKQQLASLGTDVDGDGKVTVKINQYIPGDGTSVTGNASYGRAAEIALLTDISEMESYIFLVEYPEDFQLDFQLMAHPDGSPSAEDDFGVWDKVYAWSDCPALAGLELGTETREIIEKLYVGRRCFVQENAKADSPENKALWSLITEGANPVLQPVA